MNSDIKKRIDAINNPEAIQYFFSLLKELIEYASLSETDERLVINVRNDYRKRFSVNINGRLILSIKDGNELALMINNSDLDTISNIPVLRKEVFEKQIPEANLVYFDFDVINQNSEVLKPLWLKSCLEYLPSQSASQYRRHHIDELYKIAINEDILNEYLAPVTNKVLSFSEMINELRIYIKNEDNILKDFIIFPVTAKSRWVWISDSQGILNDTIAHYEIIVRREKIYIEVHFEGNQSQKDRFSKKFSELPDKIEWFKWQNSKSMRYEETYTLEDEDILQKLANALLYLEENLGNQLRKIKNTMNTINLKHEFIEWMIKNDGDGRFYFSKQFGSNKVRFQSEIDKYEEIYKKDFNNELFVIDVKNYKKQIETIRANVYGKSVGFSEYSKNNSNGRPMAILGKNNYIKFLNEYFKDENLDNSGKTNNNEEKMVLNQILYGPPGTGKTYNTKEQAVKIANPFFVIDPLWSNTTKREEIIKEYDRLYNLGQIVFTTFHQSMSYEDFIEGIKPKTYEGKVTYAIEDGIFKSSVKNAMAEYLEKEVQKTDDFDTLYNDFVLSLKSSEGIKQGTFFTKTGIEIMLVEANQNSIMVKYLWTNSKKESEGIHIFSVTKDKLKKTLQAEIVPDKVKNLKTEIHSIVGHIHCELFAVYKKFYDFVIANKGEIEAVHFDARDMDFDDVNEQFLTLTIEEINSKEVDNHVLIVDEINRGNVSSIFGELITLLEIDKRIGENEQILIKLPYSKKEFGVPKNLYIIGTMNTADRSVEALDTALRRRFSFTEIMPNPELLNDKKVGDITLNQLLKTINKRIEVLLDRDHTIGHSYFLKVENENDLKATFKNNIIPLLQEYFYGDYEKIGLVLGKGFFEEEEKTNQNIFASFYTTDISIDKTIYKLKSIDDEFEILEALENFKLQV